MVPISIRRVKKALEFADTHEQFCSCSTHAISTLIGIPDDSVREKVISIAEKRLNQETPTGGKKIKKISSSTIKEIIAAVEAESPSTQKSGADPEPGPEHQTNAQKIESLKSEMKHLEIEIKRHRKEIKLLEIRKRQCKKDIGELEQTKLVLDTTQTADCCLTTG
jgi:hypothetical protein